MAESKNLIEKGLNKISLSLVDINPSKTVLLQQDKKPIEFIKASISEIDREGKLSLVRECESIAELE